MKITHNKIGQNLNLTDAGKTKSETVKDKKDLSQVESSHGKPFLDTADSVKVDLSTQAQDVKRIKELAKNSPDVDQAKVEKLRQMIAEGKYKVDAKAIADRMVDEHMMAHSTSND